MADLRFKDVDDKPADLEPHLDSTDLKVLFEDLFNVRAKWRRLGLELGLPWNSLVAITQKYSGHEHRLEGLLLEWLNRGAATYRQLVRALQSVPVDETELANELQRKYSLKDPPPEDSPTPPPTGEKRRQEDRHTGEEHEPHLSPTDLRVVYFELFEVRTKWRRLGIVLDLTLSTLDAIEQRDSSPEVRLGRVLKKWLCTGVASWRQLVRALRSVGEPILAKKLEEKYCLKGRAPTINCREQMVAVQTIRHRAPVPPVLKVLVQGAGEPPVVPLMFILGMPSQQFIRTIEEDSAFTDLESADKLSSERSLLSQDGLNSSMDNIMEVTKHPRSSLDPLSFGHQRSLPRPEKVMNNSSFIVPRSPPLRQGTCEARAHGNLEFTKAVDTVKRAQHGRQEEYLKEYIRVHCRECRDKECKVPHRMAGCPPPGETFSGSESDQADSPQCSSSQVSKQQSNQVACTIWKIPLIAANKHTTVQEALKFPPCLTFVKPVEVLQINHQGLMHSDSDLGLCIDIPAGAIPEDLQLRLEVGMCLFGPFKFQSNTSPIAPILMLCPQEDIALQKPIKITLPHILDGAVDSDKEALGIRVTKADHRFLFSYLGEPLQCVFEDLDLEQSKISFETQDDKEYAIFSISDFCFLCLRQNTNCKSVKGKNYCISPMYPMETAQGSALTYHFPVTYYVDPWIKVLDEQFLKEGFKVKKTARKKFSLEDTTEAFIQCEIINENDKWKVAFECLDSPSTSGTKVIPINSVDVWKRDDVDELKMDIEHLLYPPCFSVIAIPLPQNDPGFFQLHFKTSEGKAFCINLSLIDTVHPHTTNGATAQHPESNSTHMERDHHGRPSQLAELCKRFKLSKDDIDKEVSNEHILEIYLQLENWRLVAVHLGLTQADIQTIFSQAVLEGETLMRLYMLQEWKRKKILDGTATYRVLLKALIKCNCSESAIQVGTLLIEQKYTTPHYSMY